MAKWNNDKEKEIAKRFYAMKRRCYNKNCKCYNRYGNRGITICDEWLCDIKLFVKWSLENGYRKDLTIERLDNDKGYSPANCAWVSLKENARNKSNIKLNENDVNIIRELFYYTINMGRLDKNRWSKKRLAKKYNMSFCGIKKVLNGKRWR